MSFGISPDRQRSVMIGADVAVAFVDRATGKGDAHDYHLADKSQCSGQHGSCPDTRLRNGTDSVLTLNAALVNGFSIVTYQRPLDAVDAVFDLRIPLNETTPIVWAIGPLNERQEVSFHTHYNRKTQTIQFGRKPIWNCQLPDGQGPTMQAAGDGAAEDYRRPPSRKRPAHADDAESTDDEDVDEDVDDEEDRAPNAYLPRPQRPPQQQRPAAAVDNRRQEIVRRRPGDEPVLIANDNANNNGGGPNRHRGQPAHLQSTQNNNFDNNHPAVRPVPTPKPASRAGAWEIPPIQCYEPEDGVFYAQMGPTGGRQGYPAITGHVGWGISWYINGLLIPEINVVRGRTYTFVVESGHDPEVPAKYHPFYITDDPVGGYEYKTAEERQAVRIFAGVHRSRGGQVSPIGTGRLCNWTPDLDGPPADEYSSFGAYQRSLTLRCDEGEAGIIVWRPDEQTPDTVYYQCFTHRHLGWKINVLDHCDEGPLTGQASEVHEVFAEPDQQQHLELDGDVGLLQEASIRHETKVRPNENFLLQHEKDLLKNHNMNEQPPKLKFDGQSNMEISKLITEGIRAAEALEDSIAHQRPSGISGGANRTQTSTTTLDASEHIEFKVIPKQQQQQQQQKLQQHQPHGVKSPSLHKLQQQQHYNNNKNVPTKEIPSFVADTSPLSEYLRPPGVQNGPLFRPLKIAGRPRPASPPSVEIRGRPSANGGGGVSKPGSNNGNGPYRVAQPIPQPSIIVNHYKKPIPALIRPFVKSQKPPIQSLASVLLLGQPTELSPLRKHYEHSGNNQKAAPPAFVKNSGSANAHSNKPRDSYAPKYAYSVQMPPGNSNNNKHTFQHQHQQSVETPILSASSQRKKPIHLQREPHLPLKAIKNTFKSPYEITGPKFLGDSAATAGHSGFQPDTLIVEGGFKPIVRRRNGNSNDGNDDDDGNNGEVMLTSANRRSDDNLSADDASTTDGTAADTTGEQALFVNQSADMPAVLFEPMFIPSPPDSINGSNKIGANKSVPPPSPSSPMEREREHLSGDLVDMAVEMGDDKQAMAAERVDAYYLPPDAMARAPPQHAANFFPEGSVVTFDGKAVLDTSLVNSLPIRTYAGQSGGGHHDTNNANVIVSSVVPFSKTEQLIRSTPQFGPFRGEIPPIGVAEIATVPLTAGAAERYGSEQKGTYPRRPTSAELKAAERAVVTEYTNPLTNSTAPISTRLVLLPLRNKRGEATEENKATAAAAQMAAVGNEATVAGGGELVVAAATVLESTDGVDDAPAKRTIKVRGVVL